MKHWLSHHWLRVLAIIVVLGPLLPVTLPYVYYQLMNWVVTIAALLVAKLAHEKKQEWAMWVFAVVAIVFNPIEPLYLRADMWLVADVIVAILLLASIFVVKPKK